MHRTLFLLLPLFLFSEEITVYPWEDKPFVLQVDPQDSVDSLFNKIGAQTEQPVYLVLGAQTAKSATSIPRNYLLAVTSAEKQDISFIVNTLGMSSLAKINKSKSSLKSAGDRVNHIHPLRFLSTIFLDDRMKASMQALHKRSFVWDEFISGLKSSLTEEAGRNNLPVEYIQDFSAILSISFDQIYPIIQQAKWEQLVKTLIQTIPRNDDANRYDM